MGKVVAEVEFPLGEARQVVSHWRYTLLMVKEAALCLLVKVKAHEIFAIQFERLLKMLLTSLFGDLDLVTRLQIWLVEAEGH